MNNPVVRQTAGIAIASLVLGILGLVCFGPLCAVPAVICGHVGMSRIKRSAGALAGEGLALAGLIMGYVSLALMLIMIPIYAAIAIPSFMRARQTSQVNSCMNNMRLISGAIQQWALENDKTAEDVVTETDIQVYLKDDRVPECPLGGAYILRTVADEPVCPNFDPVNHPAQL